MARKGKNVRPARLPAEDLEAEIIAIIAMNIDQLRGFWREQRRSEPPPGFTKDLLARALTYDLQERALGGLSASTARLLRSLRKPNSETQRHIKIGSVLIREYERRRHEVIAVRGGFLWEGDAYESLSVIARKITGTSWNGPRFFGLRDKGQRRMGEGEEVRSALSNKSSRAGRRSSVNSTASSPALGASGRTPNEIRRP